MAEYNAPATLTTGGGTITFNDATGDTGIHDAGNCTGLDQAPIRATIEDKPQAAGGIWQPFLSGPRRVVLAGEIVIRSAGDEAGYLGAVADWENALVAALVSTYAQDNATYAWTASNGDTYTITVRCELPAVFTGDVPGKRYQFGLVAINPTITVT